MIPAIRLLALLLVVLTTSAQTAPPVESARVIRSYPHDTAAFTEGLLIDRGALYESTGREGSSFIRCVDLATGRVLHSVALLPELFGEGIAVWKREMFSVTWHGGRGFRWSLPALRPRGGFVYAGEGWAMTDDGHALILSDGTPTLRFLNPETQRVVRTLSVTAEGAPVTNLNELEYVDGEILANIWHTPLIARIDPRSGHVIGWIDLSALAMTVAATDSESVANGIAYDRTAHRLYVTGKNWPKLFEIARPSRIARKDGGR